MNISQPTRVIKYRDQTLADLNPEATVEEVVRMHAAAVPELATAVAEGPVIELGTATYTVNARLGTKG